MRLQRQSNGEVITLDRSTYLDRGGEGEVHKVGADLVAKVYHALPGIESQKLAVMLANPPDDPMAAQGHVSIAWPVDLLLTTGGAPRTAGFLMPFVGGMASLEKVYVPKSRREHYSFFNYLYLHRTAGNLAAAVHALHGRGYVVGDVNESNIRVADTALVTLVDTDSFQVLDPKTGVIYRCPVGKPEFTPPELQGQSLRDIDRAAESDRFGLAVLIFQLLMEGTHPFSGVFTGAGEAPSIEARISAGHFPHGNVPNSPYRPMPAAPLFTILHPGLRQLFARCFVDGHANPKARPSPEEWLQALEIAENLAICPQNAQHYYGDHLPTCPWCERAQMLGGHDPFPSVEAVQAGTHLRKAPPKQKPLSPSPNFGLTHAGTSPSRPTATLRASTPPASSAYAALPAFAYSTAASLPQPQKPAKNAPPWKTIAIIVMGCLVLGALLIATGRLPSFLSQLAGIQTQQISKDVHIPYPTKTIRTNALLMGERQTQQSGKVGIMSVVYEIKTRGGNEVEKQVITKSVKTAPIPQIILIGTRASAGNSGTPITEVTRRIIVPIARHAHKTPSTLAAAPHPAHKAAPRASAVTNDLHEHSSIGSGSVAGSVVTGGSDSSGSLH